MAIVYFSHQYGESFLCISGLPGVSLPPENETGETMTKQLDEKLEPIYQEVIKRNPGEIEFHQAVREVFESLGPVLVKYPEFGDRKIIERICEPERQIIFRVPWQDEKGEVQTLTRVA